MQILNLREVAPSCPCTYVPVPVEKCLPTSPIHELFYDRLTVSNSARIS